MIGTVATSLARWRLLELRDIQVHFRRSAIIVLIVSAAVALMVGVFTTYGSISTAVERLSGDTAGKASLAIRGATATVDADLAETVRHVDGVAAAVPVIQQQVDYRVGDDARTTLVMSSPAAALKLESKLSTALAAEVIGQPDVLSGSDAVIAGPDAGMRIGQRLTFGDQEVVVRSIATTRELNDGNYVLASMPLAERIIAAPGHASAIYVVAREGVDVDELAKDVQAIAGGAIVSRPDFQVEQVAQSTALLTNAALLVALVSFVVAAFLIYNTLHMAVAQRRTSMSVLRAIGAEPAVLFRNVLYASIIYAALGSAIGIGVGLAAGRMVIGLLPPFVLQSVAADVVYSINPVGPVGAFGAALISCVVASLAAGAQIFRVSPVEALSGETIRSTKKLWTFVVGGVGLVAVIGSFWVAHQPAKQGALIAAALIVLGTIALMYGLARPLVALCAKLLMSCGPLGALASAGVARSPSRSWSSIVTLVIAIGVAVGASGALTSMADTTTRSMSTLTDTDIFVTRTPSDVLPAGAALPDSYEELVERTPGVAGTVPGRWLYADFEGSQITIQGVAADSHAVSLNPLSDAVRAQLLAGDGVVVSQQLARDHDLHVGGNATLVTPAGRVPLRILAVAPYISIANGTMAMSLDTLSALYPEAGISFLEVSVADGASVTSVMEDLSARLPPEAYVYDGEAALTGTTAAIGQAGIIAVALQWMVGGVAAVGIFTIFNLTVMERRREIGTLRAIGAPSGQAMRMVILEALSMASVGGVIGYLLGLGVHYLACLALGSTTAIPVTFSYHPLSIALAVLGVAICLLGSVVPAYRESRVRLVASLAEA